MDKAKYAKDDRLYFSPSIKRMPHGSRIPAGMVIVTEVVDHGPQEYFNAGRDRWTYVVRPVDKPDDVFEKQGAAEEELHVWTGN